MKREIKKIDLSEIKNPLEKEISEIYAKWRQDGMEIHGNTFGNVNKFLPRYMFDNSSIIAREIEEAKQKYKKTYDKKFWIDVFGAVPTSTLPITWNFLKIDSYVLSIIFLEKGLKFKIKKDGEVGDVTTLTQLPYFPYSSPELIIKYFEIYQNMVYDFVELKNNKEY
jgi:hypothetical protein